MHSLGRGLVSRSERFVSVISQASQQIRAAQALQEW